MSDEIMQDDAITGEELAKHIFSVSPDILCPVCGHDDLAINATSRYEKSTIFVSSRAAGEKGAPYYLMTCENCGFMWSFRVAIVNKKVAERSQDKSSEGEINE